MNEDELPEGWELKPLRACVAPKQIWNATRQPRDRIRYIELSGIDNQRGVITNVSDLAADEAPSRAKKVVRQGDVIFATTRPNLKNIALVPGELDNEICSTGFCVLRPLQAIVTSGWLFAVCRSDVVVTQVVKHDEKNAYPSVSDEEVLDCMIPVPPPEEQKRLLKRIEALTSRLEQARQARRSALAEAETVILSATQAAFAPDSTELWDELPFDKATKRVQPRGGKLKTDEYRDEGVLPIVDQGQALICGYTDDLTRNFQGPLPVIVFGDHTRNVKFVDFDFAVGADGTVLLHTCDRIEPSFFYHWLRAVELHNLGYSRHFKLLGETTVRYPPDRAEQRRIVSRLGALAAKHAELRRLQTETEAELAAFTPALLTKAFRGEL
jgi:type I restriction enzyme S subunit